MSITKDLVLGKIKSWWQTAVIVILAIMVVVLLFKWIGSREALTTTTNELNKKALALVTCEGNYTGLTAELDKLKVSVAQVKGENDALRDAVTASSETVRNISNNLGVRLRQIRDQRAGSTCEERFQWLRDKAEEIR
jgi:uncharacterized membrane protein